MKLRRLTELSLLTSVALIMFIIEQRFPDIAPIPGVKLGFANIVTVYAVYRYHPGESAMMVTARLLLGALFSSNVSALIYSAAGAYLCLVGMLGVRYIIPEKHLWLCSVIGAMLHNTGQIAAAVVMMHTTAVISYFPVLMVSGTIAGLFTGICTQFLVKRTNRSR